MDFTLLIGSIVVNILTSQAVLLLILIISLVICSAFISGAEVAFFSLTSSDLVHLRTEKKSKKNKILSLLSKPNQLLATILITNNFVNIAIIVLSAFFTEIIFDFPTGTKFEFIFQVIIITCILVLLGEITPKIYANQHALLFSKLMCNPLVILRKILYPFNFLLISTTTLIDKRLKNKQTEVSIEEISKALDLTSKQSNEEERRILKSILEFGNTDVKEIMKSRVDVIAVKDDMSFSNVISLILGSGYSRIPVFKDQFDNILGILYIKDLIPHLDKDDNYKWIELCRPPYFIPENKMINDLLKEFQVKKNHLAIVVDEYGGASGIVTLEDVLEEIVGEINDEFDDDEIVYSKIENNTYIFEGKILLIDFLKIVNGKSDYFDKIKGESDTLAGLVLEIEGKIPAIGHETIIEPYTFKVESVDMRKIKRFKVAIDEK